MSAHARVLRDAGHNISIDDILGPSSASPFATFENVDGILSFGFTQDVIWLRWRITQTNSEPATWWLQVAPTFLDEVRFYAQNPDGTLLRLKAGDHVPLKERSVASRHFLFPLTLTNEPQDLYVRIHSSSTVTANFDLWQPNAFLDYVALQNLLYGLLFGSTLLAIIIAVFSGLWLRHGFFLVAALYLLAYGFLHLTLNGFDQWLLYPSSPHLSDNMVGVAGYGTAGTLPALVLSYLQPKREHPWLWGLLIACIGMSGIGVLVSMLGLYALIAPYLMVLGAIIVAALLVLCLRTFRHHSLEASLMLLLFGPGFVAVFFQALRNLGYLPLNFWTSHLWAVTALFQVLFIAVVVLLKVREEQTLLRAERERSEVERQFLGMMAHELRTPLAIFASALTNIQLQVQSWQPELIPRFQRVTTALARMNTLIDNALAEDRLNSDGLQLEFQSVRPSQLVEQIQELILIDGKHRLQVSLPADDQRFQADPYWLVLAVLNLLDNAVKYSPQGGVIQLTLAWDGASLEIRVQDSGIGIPQEALEHLFERFFRASNAKSLPGVSGIGLGLYLVKKVVDGHKGKLRCESASDGGTLFVISLPAETRS